MYKACKAARTVAALLHFRAIGVKNTITKIHFWRGRRFHHQQLIKTYTKVTIGHLAYLLFAQLNGCAGGIQYHKVIAEAVHFSKGQMGRSCKGHHKTPNKESIARNVPTNKCYEKQCLEICY